MKNLNLVLSTIALTVSTSAFAHVLPADAINEKIESVSIEEVATGQTLVSEGNDGPVYNNTYTQMLDVVLTYASKDHTDDATGLDEDGNETVVGGPTLSFNLPVTAAEVAAIKAHTLDPKSLVTLNVSSASVQINNPVFTSACRFNNDSSQPENPECIQNVSSAEVRPVVSVSRK